MLTVPAYQLCSHSTFHMCCRLHMATHFRPNIFLWRRPSLPVTAAQRHLLLPEWLQPREALHVAQVHQGCVQVPIWQAPHLVLVAPQVALRLGVALQLGVALRLPRCRCHPQCRCPRVVRVWVVWVVLMGLNLDRRALCALPPRFSTCLQKWRCLHLWICRSAHLQPRTLSAIISKRGLMIRAKEVVRSTYVATGSAQDRTRGYVSSAATVSNAGKCSGQLNTSKA